MRVSGIFCSVLVNNYFRNIYPLQIRLQILQILRTMLRFATLMFPLPGNSYLTGAVFIPCAHVCFCKCAEKI